MESETRAKDDRERELIPPRLSRARNALLLLASLVFYPATFFTTVSLWHLCLFVALCSLVIGRRGWLDSLRPLGSLRRWGVAFLAGNNLLFALL